MSKPFVRLGNLMGPEGNAYVILGRCQEAARKAGWDKAQVDAFFKDAQSADYNHLLAVVDKNFKTQITRRG